MKFTCFILIVSTVFFSCRVSRPMSEERERSNINQVLNESNFESAYFDEIKSSQRRIIAGLTGMEKINEIQTINRRWTNEERNLSRDFLGNMITKIGLLVLTNSYEINKPTYDKPLNPLTGTNIYTIIPATVDSDEYVILGAHFDTVLESSGASDNASGCALVYGVGMALSKVKERKKNVILIFFDQEERGLLGSLSFVDKLKKENYSIHSVHTADMIGWDADGDRNIEIEKPSSELKSIYRQKSKEFGIISYQTSTTSTDHKAFRDAG